MSDLYFNKENDYNGKKNYGNESYKKETKSIYAIAASILHIRIGNFDWCKCRHCKNKAREIDCLCCREVDERLIALPKYQSAREASRHLVFRGNCPTISHTS